MTPRELMRALIARFDPRTSLTLERALIDVLMHEHGLTEAEAAELAAARAQQVQVLLAGAMNLPFEVVPSHPTRLVGIQRHRASDTVEVVAAREKLGLRDAMLDALFSLGDDGFEHICAKLLREAGATDAHVTRVPEGGIDVYGRFPLQLPPPIPASILRTTLFGDRGILILAQCKCYNPATAQIGRPDVQQFDGQAKDCLNKYEDNPRPPANRVPKTYYQRNEPSMRLFFTTTSFSADAESSAMSLGITLVSGLHIAELLLHHEAGMRRNGEEWELTVADLEDWIR